MSFGKLTRKPLKKVTVAMRMMPQKRRMQVNNRLKKESNKVEYLRSRNDRSETFDMYVLL